MQISLTVVKFGVCTLLPLALHLANHACFCARGVQTLAYLLLIGILCVPRLMFFCSEFGAKVLLLAKLSELHRRFSSKHFRDTDVQFNSTVLRCLLSRLSSRVWGFHEGRYRGVMLVDKSSSLMTRRPQLPGAFDEHFRYEALSGWR